jgi:hypothetical protein
VRNEGRRKRESEREEGVDKVMESELIYRKRKKERRGEH